MNNCYDDYITNTAEMDLTPSQERRLEQFAQVLLVNDGSRTYKNDYEFKQWEVRQVPGRGGLVFLTSEVGNKGDDGTLLSVFGRTYRHIMISKGGGCELLNHNKKVFGYRNILSTLPKR